MGFEISCIVIGKGSKGISEEDESTIKELLSAKNLETHIHSSTKNELSVVGKYQGSTVDKGVTINIKSEYDTGRIMKIVKKEGYHIFNPNNLFL